MTTFQWIAGTIGLISFSLLFYMHLTGGRGGRR